MVFGDGTFGGFGGAGGGGLTYAKIPVSYVNLMVSLFGGRADPLKDMSRQLLLMSRPVIERQMGILEKAEGADSNVYKELQRVLGKVNEFANKGDQEAILEMQGELAGAVAAAQEIIAPIPEDFKFNIKEDPLNPGGSRFNRNIPLHIMPFLTVNQFLDKATGEASPLTENVKSGNYRGVEKRELGQGYYVTETGKGFRPSSTQRFVPIDTLDIDDLRKRLDAIPIDFAGGLTEGPTVPGETKTGRGPTEPGTSEIGIPPSIPIDFSGGGMIEEGVSMLGPGPTVPGEETGEGVSRTGVPPTPIIPGLGGGVAITGTPPTEPGGIDTTDFINILDFINTFIPRSIPIDFPEFEIPEFDIGGINIPQPIPEDIPQPQLEGFPGFTSFTQAPAAQEADTGFFNQEQLRPLAGLNALPDFSPTRGNIFSAKQKPLRGLAFLS